MKIEYFNGANRRMLGYLPDFLSDHNPEPARFQLDANYRHGGGWDSFKGFKFDPRTLEIKYPGDPPTRPLARITMREEQVIIYEHAWVLILQKDGSYEIARMD